MNKPLKCSLLLTTLLAPMFISAQANADSVHEWSYWDAAPEFEDAGLAFNNSYNHNPTTGEQTRIGTNHGELAASVESAEQGDTSPWIGYALAFVSSSSNINSDNKVATLHITPHNTALSLGEGYGGTVKVTSDYAPYNMSFDSADNLGTPTSNKNFAFNYANAEGGFSGGQSTNSADGSSSSVNIYASGDVIGNEARGTFLGLGGIGRSVFNNPSNGPLSYEASGGPLVIGKLMPLSDIAAEAARNASYTFSGRSFMGSIVGITVNFGSATWSGNWGSNYSYNGFDASGTIKGTTLTSSSVTAALNTNLGGGVVTGGTVTGSLIGTMNAGVDSNAAIIGKTQLNVNFKGDNSVVNDIYAATLPVPVGCESTC